jgi:hypothetical protein
VVRAARDGAVLPDDDEFVLAARVLREAGILAGRALGRRQLLRTSAAGAVGLSSLMLPAAAAAVSGGGGGNAGASITVASGGYSLESAGSTRLLTFTSSGSFTLTGSLTDADLLIVGGGGAGGGE